MATYSKYTGTYYETISSSLLLNNAGTQSYAFTNNIVYTDLLDNTLKLIEPKSIRNAILSVYDTIPFKETIVGTNSYIGIDNGDPSNMDLKRKIYLGKRYYSGKEIMNSTLLSNDTDLFIYNTRSDTGVSQDKTSVVFLAGTDATLNENAPKLQSELFYDKTGAKTIALNLLNTDGDINVISKGPNPGDSGATVSLNNIVFPAVQDSDPSLGGVSDNKVLLYNNGSLGWSDLTINYLGYYGATGTTLPIYGNPTYLNGYPLEFDEYRYCPIEIGDINLGDTFNNVSISSILERIIYDYLNPLCTLSLYNTDKYFEVGSYPNVKLNYSITKRTNNTLPTALSNMIPNSYPAITSSGNSYVTGVATGVVISPIEKNTTVFSIKVSDGVNVSYASESVSGVYPYFYGFTSSTSITTSGLSTLNKTINTRESSTIDIYESGVLSSDLFYFIYDYDYGLLSSISDQNNIDRSSYFTNDVITLSSPSGLWASKKFRIYKSTLIANIYITGYAYPNNQGTMIFNFNFTPIVPVVPINTVTPASSTPTLCVNSPLIPITHNTTEATGIAPTTTNYGLPTGVTAVFTGNPLGGTITISGTPTTTVGSPFNYIIPLTGGSVLVNATGTITVKPLNTVTAASSSPTVMVNTPITSITHTTTGATGIMSGGSGLPTGVTAVFTGNSTLGTITISGTPTTIVGSPFNYIIRLAGGCGVVNATGTITVQATNTVSVASSSPTLCINTTLTAIKHTTTGALGIGIPTGLPTGVTAVFTGNSTSGTITISGTPTISVGSPFNYTIPLTGGVGSVNATGTITVKPLNTVSAASSSPTILVNTALTPITHTTTGATGIVTPVLGLPAGITAVFTGNSTSGTITISGTPNTILGSPFNYSITLTGGCGSVNTTGTIAVKSLNTVSVASSSPTILVNTALTPITHTTTGASGIGVPTGLPTGVTAVFIGNSTSGTITISGTPTTLTGSPFNYTIPLTGGFGSLNATGTITVQPLNTVSVVSSNPTKCINTYFTTITHNTTGATGISTTSGLPAGVTAVFTGNSTLGTITISGTPTTLGSFNYNIPLTGGFGSVNATGTITVNLVSTVTAASSSPTVLQNTPLNAITHNTTGTTGIVPTTNNYGLPAGVTAVFTGNSTSGTITISGTPTIFGNSFNYNIPLLGCGSATGTIIVTAVEVTINTSGGPQVWTLTNFDGTKYTDGTSIPQVTDPVQWGSTSTKTGAWCYHNNDPSTEAVYGKLYNWYAVMGIHDAASLADPALRKQFAPTGWHVPSRFEWDNLLGGIYYYAPVGGGQESKKLKEVGSSHWLNSGQINTNSTGFTALGGGYRNGPNNIGTFDTIKFSGRWWSSSYESWNSPYSWFMDMTYYSEPMMLYNYQQFGLSVRFIKD